MPAHQALKLKRLKQHGKRLWQEFEETKQIQAETVRNREEGRKRIEKLQLEYEKLKRM